MKYSIALIGLLIAVASAAAGPPAKPAVSNNTAGANTYKEITWDELVPKDWDPSKAFKNLNLNVLNDADPRAMKVLDIMKREWDNAPINPALDGKKVKIPGFVVPIEQKDHMVSEFLLVPYFGACIHVPPPPANQIIHVISAKPIKDLHAMDTVWVTGDLKAAHYATQTDMGLGASGYQLGSAMVTAYKEPITTMTPSR